MGRPTKQGIEFFSLDVQFDDKMELYLLETEAVGLAVFITLLQIIYQNEGFYIQNSKDLRLLIKKRINVDINLINVCINTMLERNIFNKQVYEKHGVLTSSGIQKRFFDAARRKKEVRAVGDYLLVDRKNYENLVYVDINPVNDSKNPEIDDKNATKEKEKEKEKEEVKEYKKLCASKTDAPPSQTPKSPHDVVSKPPEAAEFYITMKKKRLSGKKLERFNEFWHAFNWPKGKAAAADAWLDIKEMDEALFIEIIKAAEITARGRPRLIKNGHTPKWAQGWLNARRWEDEISSHPLENEVSSVTLRNIQMLNSLELD